MKDTKKRPAKDSGPTALKRKKHSETIRFGEEMRAERYRLGWSQEELANKSGLSRAYVGRVENNVRCPSLRMVFLICDAMKASPSTLIARVEKKRKAAKSKSR